MRDTNVPTDEIVASLTEVRELLADPSRWTRQAAARNQRGEPTTPDDDDATCWCLTGALVKVIKKTPGYNRLYERCRMLLYIAAMELRPATPTGIAVINDRHGHLAVLSVVDRSIELALERKEDVND